MVDQLVPPMGLYYPNTAPAPGGALNDNVTNQNYLNPMGFSLTIKRAPSVEFFVQKMNLPGMKINSPHFPTPFVNIPESGEHIDFEPLKIIFKVDENLTNYLAIHNWLYGLGKPKRFEEYRELAEEPQFIGYGIKSDISLIILTNIKNPNFAVTFVDAFPYYISELNFDTTQPDIQYLNCAAMFRYTYYTIQKII